MLHARPRTGLGGLGLFIILWLLVTARPAAAEQPYIDRVIITNTAEKLLVYFRVAGAFAQERVRQAVLAGVPTTFTYFVELQEIRRFRPDRDVVRLEMRRTIKLDMLSEEFTVITNNEQSGARNTSDWDEAQYLMTDVSGLEVVTLEKVDPEKTYRLRVSAQILKPRLPIELKVFFFWVPLGDIETDIYEIEFRRGP